jgi:two-component system, chemotaxis family, sensor kinase Cph1
MISDTQIDEVGRLRGEVDRCEREMQRLLDGMVHDLRAAQRGIVTSVEVLREGLDERLKEELDVEAKSAIGRVLDGAAKMNPILAGVSSYSICLSAEKESFERVRTDLAVRSAMASLNRDIRESGAMVSHGELPEVFGDLERLQMLFQNLIDNAIKYRGEAVPRIEIAAAANGEEWIFSVRDKGIGIDPTYWPSLFDPFKRLHGSEIPGVGLGLAICKKIVETHGGRIWIESEAGAGATFLFTVPIEAEMQCPM